MKQEGLMSSKLSKQYWQSKHLCIVSQCPICTEECRVSCIRLTRRYKKFCRSLVSGLGRGRVRNLVPDPTPVHNPYPSDSGRVSARVWVGSQGKNLIYSI